MTGSSDGPQRSDPRIPMVLRVDFPDRQQLLDATENLSATGIFVRTERPFRVGERVTLSLSFPGLLEPMQLVGEIVWLRPAGFEAPGGVGVCIPPDRDDDRKKLR